MDMLLFWVVACYLLGYGAFFLALFPISEKLLSGGAPYNWKTYWGAMFWTTALSLGWPFLVIRSYVRSRRVSAR